MQGTIDYTCPESYGIRGPVIGGDRAWFNFVVGLFALLSPSPAVTNACTKLKYASQNFLRPYSVHTSPNVEGKNFIFFSLGIK